MAGKAHLNIFEMVELVKAEQCHIWKPAFSSLLQEKQWEGAKQEEKKEKIEDKFDAGDYYTLIEYLSRWVGF